MATCTATPDDLIDEIYRTKSVVGGDSVAYELHSAIDRQEGQFLAELIRDDPAITRTLEVGCAYGLSSLYICSALTARSGASHTIVDPFQHANWHGAGVANLERAGVDFFNLLEERSELALPRLLHDAEGGFDFVFIDGMHTFDHTLVDCFYANRLLRVGGLLVLDDLCMPGVYRAAKYIANYPCYEFAGAVPPQARLANLPERSSAASIGAAQDRTTFFSRLGRSVFKRRPGMIAMRKTAADQRPWNWYRGGF